MLLTVGSIIKDITDEYILDGILGKGGFACVYKAHRKSDDTVVAVKTLLSSFDNPESMLSFQKEISQASLISSEHIIKYFFANDGNTYTEFPPYIIMEYADGGTVDELINCQIQKGELFDTDFILSCCLQLAYGMKEISNYFVHRDIKPANILIKNGKLKISDFGLSKFSNESTNTLTLKGFGTQKYVAPEAWNNEKNTIQMDIYSMGIVFYELATLRYPYDDTKNKNYRELHLYNAPINPNKFNANLPPHFVSMIIKMLEKPTQKRFKDWDDVIQALTLNDKPSDDIGKIVNTALHNRNNTDLMLQEQEANYKKEQEEKHNHCLLVKSQYDNTILAPIKEFISQFSEQYSGESRFDVHSMELYDQKLFSYTIDTPIHNRITIITEIIFKENHKKKVKCNYDFDFEDKYRYVNYVPECNNQEIVAWSQVSDSNGRGFNLILLKSNESLYGDWYVLKNTNSGLNSYPRNEPFGFEIKELPDQIVKIRALGLYNMDLFPLDNLYVVNFIAQYV